MATINEIEPTRSALARELRRAFPSLQWVGPDDIQVEPYGNGIDSRNGWDTHIVTVKEVSGVYGFTDGPIEGGEG